VRRLDETNAEAAMRSPETFHTQAGEMMPTIKGAIELVLLPYGLVQIEAVESVYG